MVNRHGFLEDGDLYSEDGHSQAESQRDTHHGAFGYTQNDSSDEEAGLFERVDPDELASLFPRVDQPPRRVLLASSRVTLVEKHFTPDRGLTR